METLYKTARKSFYFIIGKRSWRIFEYFDPAWKKRIQEMASYIPNNTSVVDLGCGKMWLREYLHNNIYYPVDYTDRGPGTIVCDFNQKEYPAIQTDVAFVSGVLEYVEDADWFISCIAENSNQCVISYCTREDHADAKFRRRQSWVNSFSHTEIIDLFSQAGFALKAENQTPSRNHIFNFVKKQHENN